MSELAAADRLLMKTTPNAARRLNDIGSVVRAYRSVSRW